MREVREGPGRDPLEAAPAEVEADDLRNHLERVRLNLLKRVGVKVQGAEVRDVWKENNFVSRSLALASLE